MKYSEAHKIGLIEVVIDSIYKIRIYKDRLAICRHDKKDMSWSEAQKVKENIWGDVFCIEVYPKSKNVVNKYPTKHL